MNRIFIFITLVFFLSASRAATLVLNQASVYGSAIKSTSQCRNFGGELFCDYWVSQNTTGAPIVAMWMPTYPGYNGCQIEMFPWVSNGPREPVSLPANSILGFHSPWSSNNGNTPGGPYNAKGAYQVWWGNTCDDILPTLGQSLGTYSVKNALMDISERNDGTGLTVCVTELYSSSTSNTLKGPRTCATEFTPYETKYIPVVCDIMDGGRVLNHGVVSAADISSGSTTSLDYRVMCSGPATVYIGVTGLDKNGDLTLAGKKEGELLSKLEFCTSTCFKMGQNIDYRFFSTDLSNALDIKIKSFISGSAPAQAYSASFVLYITFA